jgi:hypothetical protein
VHDLWHVLFGCDTSTLGELALKAVEALQTGLPSAGLAAAVAPLRLPRRRRSAFAAVYLPWALRAGGAAQDLMCLRYEEALHEPLEARARLHSGALRLDSGAETRACLRRWCARGGASCRRRACGRRWLQCACESSRQQGRALRCCYTILVWFTTPNK